ncbi:MAG TPA: MarR family transcriptional regulator [Nocardioidaceae bacterium]|nr:MarR family transcriptional regulator [Nocardioidaceae bacterium]
MTTSGSPSPELSQFTGYLLRRAFVKATGVAKACMPDAHVRQVALMTILAEHGAVSQSKVTDLTGVNRSLMVKLVDELETAGWVARERNPEDRRSYALRLTAAGSRSLQEMHTELDRAEAELTQVLTPAEVHRLKLQLRRLLAEDSALSVQSLTERSGYLIAHAHRLLRDWALTGLDHLALHPREFGVLATLGQEEPCSQSHLAALLGVSPPAMLGFVDALEERGLVSRVRKASDRRAYDVTLTTAGRSSLQAAQRAAVHVQGRVVARLGERGDLELRRLLMKLLASDLAPPGHRHPMTVAGAPSADPR